MIRGGETFIWGRHQVTAIALLAAADRLGVDPILVRATDTGFIVPDEVADEAADDLQAVAVEAPVTASTPPPPDQF